ncbi:MAG: DegT/DnrJ/EryC1/StrS family aminotransferase [Saccharofermentanales bacterium]|jgi:UDP-2-acetamido-2-deoxy-ribo-hexuluronate aminotransferase
MNDIVFRDLKSQYRALKEEIDGAIMEVLASGQFIGGSQVENLERILAEYVNVKNCITCANGTDALQLVMAAYGIGPGDAVFIPDFTFFATGEMIPMLGATPVFVDVDARTFNMDPNSLENAIEGIEREGLLRPKAVIPVDLFGLPAQYPRISEIARSYGLVVIEDGAQGFGGAIGKELVCSFGDAATTSFFPAKPLGCYGDGGAIFTNDDEIARLVRSMKVHGKGEHKYENVRIGMNSRLDTIQAAVLRVKLQAFLEYELAALNSIHKRYSEELSEDVVVPFIPDGYFSCNAQYTIKLPSESARNHLHEFLALKGIPTMIYYPIAMHAQKAFHEIGVAIVELDVTTELCKTVLSLPMHPYLSHDDVSRIIDMVKRGLATRQLENVR